MAWLSGLEDRVVLLTGGANGIGAATVRAFHEHGARVCFCDVDAKNGRALAASFGNSVSFHRVDLRKEAEVRDWVRAAGKRYQRMDVLVNNAARDPRIPLHRMTTAQWDDLFAVNLRAYFLTCREAVKFMPRRGGSIINFASITFHSAPASMTAYVATKGGILAFTRSLARELGPRRIRVNTISPGWIMTDRQLRQYITPAIKRLVRRSQCVPDLIAPEEIADIVLFLASDASRAITGQEVLADRGWQHS
jgi:NAD(P)-dependent dehydrogenase (short-subunit alcohol dehydrogenase family)